MKIYLQDCKTLKFIRCDSSWCSDLTEALDFISVRRAAVYGLTELKDAFQLLQVETDGLQSHFYALIPQLPRLKPAKVPSRAVRMAGAAREIVRRIKTSQASRQIVPVMDFSTPGLLHMPGDGGQKF